MRMRVSIDPGHGGSNKGADMGPMIEKRYTFSLSGLLMETMPDGIDAFRTRDRDDYVKLVERARIAKEVDADLTISLHVNGQDSRMVPVNKRLRGCLTFFFEGDELAEAAAKGIIEAMPEALKPRFRGGLVQLTRKRPSGTDAWLRRVWNVLSPYETPALLLECGYYSHPDDLAALMNPVSRREISAAIVHGIIKAKEHRDAGNI